MVMEGRDLIRSEEVLEKYPISRSTLDRVVRDHHLRYFRIAGRGRRRYYDPADVEALFISSTDEESTDEDDSNEDDA
jgi:hypothetical protein